MNELYNMQLNARMKSVFLQIFLLLCGIQVWSQSDRLDSLLNDVLGNDREIRKFLNPPSSFCYLYGTIAGDSKTYYAGRELGDDMVSVNGSLYFMHSFGFFIGASGSWYSQFDPAYGTTITSTGINRAINHKNNLAFRASYSRYFYHSADAETAYRYNNNIGTGLTWKSKWIGGRLSVNLLFGHDFGMNITPNVFSRIPLVRFGKYNKIQIEPELSAFIGAETIESASTGNDNGQISGTQTETITEDVYGLLNTNFYLPVCLYIGDFDLELGYSLNIPTTQEKSISYPVSSFFSVSLGYMLPLN